MCFYSIICVFLPRTKVTIKPYKYNNKITQKKSAYCFVVKN